MKLLGDIDYGEGFLSQWDFCLEKIRDLPICEEREVKGNQYVIEHTYDSYKNLYQFDTWTISDIGPILVYNTSSIKNFQKYLSRLKNYGFIKSDDENVYVLNKGGKTYKLLVSRGLHQASKTPNCKFLIIGNEEDFPCKVKSE